MTEKFKGYIDITIGKALYSQKHKMSSYRTRFEILWGAIKNLFTGRGVWLSGRIQANIGDLELSSETWIKQEGEESLWEHWCVFFDGKKAVGYVNGQEVNK